MIAAGGGQQRPDHERIVITGVGLTAPNGDIVGGISQQPLGRAERRHGL